jgi:hypothetical protein
MLSFSTNFRFLLRPLAGLALMGSFACESRRTESPFSADETNQALSPAKQLRPRCYDSSALARAKKGIVLDFQLEIAPSGSVRATPTFAAPEDPEIIECVRHVLNTIVFPARGRDRLDLHFEMGAEPSKK